MSGRRDDTASDATVLAFDFGTRRIGVAVGNTIVRVAHALTTIDASAAAPRFAAIAALIDEWHPQRLVVGVPLHDDGSEHAITARARGFARQLEGRYRLPVDEVDERYTTELAAFELAAQRAGRRGRARRDEVAAKHILQGYFDGLAKR
ncbi:MAG TPA: Holliday junction resolvase RuvX [Casimicrobiaceae bacterium]|nr:Holliday junction resolvase RuvX [Casimicrobiaceae bacterium]